MTEERREVKVRPNPQRKGRSLQRQRALDVLFEADARGVVGLADLLKERQAVSTAQKPIGEYGVRIVDAIANNAGNIDSMIEAASPAWALDRMALVDRNILRIGTAELMFLDLDIAVVAKEVGSLAREFSTDKAVGFTMGVINRVAEIYALETSGQGEKIDQLPLAGSEMSEPESPSSGLPATTDQENSTLTPTEE